MFSENNGVSPSLQGILKLALEKFGLSGGVSGRQLHRQSAHNASVVKACISAEYGDFSTLTVSLAYLNIAQCCIFSTLAIAKCSLAIR